MYGHFDGVFGRTAMGWAFDPAHPDQPVTVVVLAGERIVAEAVADIYREDLLQAGIHDGRHAFKCLLPVELFDGARHEISIRVKDGPVLDGSPKPLVEKLASLEDAFAAATGAVTPPLTDFQVAMLHGLTRVCETLAEQNRVLHRLDRGTTADAAVLAPTAASAPQVTGYGVTLEDDFRRLVPTVCDVIVFSIIDWDFRIQRPQHLAANLGRMGCRVTYVSVHLEPAGADAAPFFLRAKPAPNVYEVALRCPVPVPSVYAGFTDAAQVAALAVAAQKMMAVLGIQYPVAILQYPSWAPVALSLPGATVVYDCLDHIAGFETAGPAVVGMERELIGTADLVVTSSQHLHDLVAAERPSVIIRNAAEVEVFATPPARLSAFEAVTIGYYGAISEWFDVDLVAAMAGLRPEWTFVLVGGCDTADSARLADLPNVRLIGEVPYRDLPGYLYAFDCCIIPFKDIDLIKATNPVKVYEFFAAGKPVVATDMPELRLMPQDLLRIASTETAFIDAIEDALQETGDQPLRRRLWAMENSWVSRSRVYLGQIRAQLPPVSVVLLASSRRETMACLRSMGAVSGYPGLDLVIVHDPASTERADLADLLRDAGLWCPVRVAGEVSGDSSLAEYVVVLRDTARVTDGWLRDLIRPLMEDMSVAMVTPPAAEAVLKPGEDPTGYRMRHRRMTTPASSLGVCCVAIRRHLLETMAGLDPVTLVTGKGMSAIVAAGLGVQQVEDVVVYGRDPVK